MTDPDESIEGWVPTDDGAVVVGEPQGSPGWFPCNDNPQDKATYDFAVTVPAGLTAMANGVLRLDATTRRHDDVGVARGRSDGHVPRHGRRRAAST